MFARTCQPASDNARATFSIEAVTFTRLAPPGIFHLLREKIGPVEPTAIGTIEDIGKAHS